MKIFQGTAASPGITVGPLYLYQQEQLNYERRTSSNPAFEWQRLQGAIKSAEQQIQLIQEKVKVELGADEAGIFKAQAAMLEDPDLMDSIQEGLNTQKLNAEAALNYAAEYYAQILESSGKEIDQARAVDVREVGHRVLRILLGVKPTSANLQQPSIIVARDLTPSETMRLDKTMVLGFCTAEGGRTSHTSILAKALGLPAVVGAGRPLLAFPNGTILAIDGERGEVVVDPDEEVLKGYEDRRRKADALYSAEKRLTRDPAVTMDGTQVEVVANIGSLADAEMALRLGAEGVGLLRTEFLYMDRQDPPTEEEQLAVYKAIFDVMGNRPVVVRTLDVGGDKPPAYMDMPAEDNPFLGYRAIRMCLDRPDFFKIQLRALLRASPGHDLRIMFPMIAHIDEMRKARALLEESRAEVIKAGHSIAEKIQVGIMVEVPSVAMVADQFAREVDFFSIGTNDLTQYTMAAERTNDKLSYLADACHPAILRQVQRVIESARSRGIWVGLCGELASDPDAIPILLGLGLYQFSMAPSMIPHAKAIIRRWTLTLGQKCAREVLELTTGDAVRQHMRKLRAA